MILLQKIGCKIKINGKIINDLLKLFSSISYPLREQENWDWSRIGSSRGNN